MVKCKESILEIRKSESWENAGNLLSPEFPLPLSNVGAELLVPCPLGTDVGSTFSQKCAGESNWKEEFLSLEECNLFFDIKEDKVVVAERELENSLDQDVNSKASSKQNLKQIKIDGAKEQKPGENIAEMVDSSNTAQKNPDQLQVNSLKSKEVGSINPKVQEGVDSVEQLKRSQTIKVEVVLPKQELGSILSIPCPLSKDKRIVRQYMPNGYINSFFDCSKLQCPEKELRELYPEMDDILFNQVKEFNIHMEWAVRILKSQVWAGIPVGKSLTIPCLLGKTNFKARCKLVEDTPTWILDDSQKVKECNNYCPEEMAELKTASLKDISNRDIFFDWPKTRLGRIVEVACPVGYVTDGRAYRTCLWDGSWSSIRGNCEPVYCNDESNTFALSESSGVQDFTWPFTEHGLYAEINCNSFPGHKGKMKRYCNNGKWADILEERCDFLACKPTEKSSDANGIIVLNSGWPQTAAGKSAVLNCPAKYEGKVRRSCTPWGEWGRVKGVCKALMCERTPIVLPTLEQGQVVMSLQVGKFWPRDFFGSVSTYRCPDHPRDVIQAVCRLNLELGVYQWIPSNTCGAKHCEEEHIHLPDDKVNMIAPPSRFLASDLNGFSSLFCAFPFEGEIKRKCIKSRTRGQELEKIEDLGVAIENTCKSIKCPKIQVSGRNNAGKVLTVILHKAAAGTEYRLKCPPGHYENYVAFPCSDKGEWETKYIFQNGQRTGFVDMTICKGK